jgi:hypothetical protein
MIELSLSFSLMSLAVGTGIFLGGVKRDGVDWYFLIFS